MATEKRLIDANALGNGIGVYVATNAYLNDTALDALGKVAKWIDEALTVDAVEVVRCRKCKNAVPFSWTAAGEKVQAYRCMKDEGAIGYKCAVSGDDYCSSGERRTGDAGN